MENLRWILIIAGVAILVLLYLSGRSGKSGASRRSGSMRDLPPIDDEREVDPLFGRSDEPDRLDLEFDHDVHDVHDAHGATVDEPPPATRRADTRVATSEGARSRVAAASARTSIAPEAVPVGRDEAYLEDEPIDTDSLWQDDTGDMQRPAESTPASLATRSGIGRKIESWSRKLRARARSRDEDDDGVDYETRSSMPDEEATRLLALHIEAPPGRLFAGEDLLDAFESRGYHFGDMNIFHSMHEGKPVFSVASMVEPGYFDIDAMHEYHTPGISMFMQLPGPVEPDVAFEVFLSEAQDLADTLGGMVLDAEHSSLSPQMIQHMREGIYEYMHRRRVYRGVPS